MKDGEGWTERIEPESDCKVSRLCCGSIQLTHEFVSTDEQHGQGHGDGGKGRRAGWSGHVDSGASPTLDSVTVGLSVTVRCGVSVRQAGGWGGR